ncbi:MBL fold metallo-hydrolase [Gluconobacter cerinus]
MDWLELKPEGLFCVPGAFYIDPLQPVAHAVITHGHSDHARPGHELVTGTPETLAIMRLRMGEGRAGHTQQALGYGEVISIGDVQVWLAPAGHVLGSAQVVMEYRGQRAVVSGDYKRAPDPTCVPFEVVPCDLFVTEATFGLPVFRLPDPAHEIAKLLHDVRLFPERTHVVGCYALGKCQRLIALLREGGYHAPLWLHGALLPMCKLYEGFGVPLGNCVLQRLQRRVRCAEALFLRLHRPLQTAGRVGCQTLLSVWHQGGCMSARERKRVGSNSLS